MGSQQRDVCVLSSDILGSYRIHEKLGAAEAAHAVERCMTRLERAVAVHAGTVLRVAAHELVATFPSADAALQASSEMRRRIDDLPPVSGIKLAVRSGFHLGAVTGEGRACQGEAVDVAAALCRLAAPGEIVTTEDTAAGVGAALKAFVACGKPRSLPWGGGALAVCEVTRQAGVEPMKAADFRSPPAGRLRLRHAGSEILLDGARSTVTLGRETHNDLVIADRRASRSHSRIERRRDKYVLIDESTNGTYVSFEGEAEFALKHEETILRGRGTMSFGHSQHDDGTVDIVEFEVLN